MVKRFYLKFWAGVRFPGEDVCVMGLTNCDCNSPMEVTREIAALTIDKNLQQGKIRRIAMNKNPS